MSTDDTGGGRATTDVWVIDDGARFSVPDEVACEEPLEIRLRTGDRTQSVAITMRTPGEDLELAAGFLVAEGLVRTREDLVSLESGHDRRSNAEVAFACAALRDGLEPGVERLERHFFVNSACGVCGRTEVEAIALGKMLERDATVRLPPALLYELPAKLREAQSTFARTGGLHAAAAFSVTGELVAVREDVGRHNALDKLLGWALLNNELPFRRRIVMVSGRASYELVQKASMAEAPVLCAVSAPSSLAVSLARRLGMTLIAFLRGRRFNVYTGVERLDV